ncbi:MAG: hypothetical protein C5B48_08190 [Candidatus Rokuibacteriota bacterium]|nr:MAG: hypothetical protein C5B48_08190 [Candidatus Rokubacteria bacterium]
MARLLSRRQFVMLPLAGLLVPRLAGADAKEVGARTYEAEIGVLFNLLTFRLSGRVSREIDRASGRYRVTMSGTGSGVTAGMETEGIIRDGRFMPTETRGFHTIRGRENRVTISYDYGRRLVEYHSLGYTFFLGRRRQADDVIRLAADQHVDDLVSAELNFAADALDKDSDGAYRVTVVRRARPTEEAPDDVSPDGYRAELTTLRFRALPDANGGRLTALVDLTGFSSWARSTRPASVAFGPDRHLESVASSLILGTTFTLRLSSAS